MHQFELDYVHLIDDIKANGELRPTRNAKTLSVFGRSLRVDTRKTFPILQGRRIYYKGVLGELAAMLNRPTHIEDFRKFGCNFWDLWADDKGKINVDYGNAWFDFNGFNQIKELKRLIKEDPTSRRMLIQGWRPERLDDLSLPCCHYCYQFYVEEGFANEPNILHMIWSQRSVDVMVGLPSNMVFSATWLAIIANEFNLVPGDVIMNMGDCHIYADHLKGAEIYKEQVRNIHPTNDVPIFKLWMNSGQDFCSFTPDKVTITPYHPQPAIQFKLHG